MPPTILPLYGLPSTGAGAEAEQKVTNFLKALPDQYYVLRELRTFPTLEKRQAGSTEDRPDLVVIGPDIGVIVLEVKDWNINLNTYEWLDQYRVQRTDAFGNVERLRNPFAQVDEYWRAIHDVLKTQLGQPPVRVSGFVIYPKLTQAEFKNAFVRGDSSQRPVIQERYLIDWEHVIFRDDLDHSWDDPLELLGRLVRSWVKIPYDEVIIRRTVNVLVPPKLRVGDLSKQNTGYERLLLMDDGQQKWAFSEETTGKNYMLDVAGSGKTNILLSRAMHLVNLHKGVPEFRVLLLTYSKPLARDLKRLLENKIKDQSSPDAHEFNTTIFIRDIQTLMEEILAAGLGESGAKTWQMQVRNQLTLPEEYLEYKLPEKCQDIFDEYGGRFLWFDYLLVDEVQDFSDFFLDVALSVLKQRDHVFMVGDVGQKLFDRSHNLREHGIVEERVRVPGHYRMYRSPKLIGQLAWSFLCLDCFITHELREQGYAETIKSKNTLPTQPVFKRCLTQEVLLGEVCNDIKNLVVVRARPEQVLCVGLPDTLASLYELLIAQLVPVGWANEISGDERKVTLADFVDAKGLERDYVFILDVDRLPDGSAAEEGLFSSMQIPEEEARRSRIKIFVALTRALREVHLYYIQQQKRFVSELLELKRSTEGNR